MNKNIFLVFGILIIMTQNSTAQIDWVRIYPTTSIISVYFPENADSIIWDTGVQYFYTTENYQILFASQIQEINFDSLLRFAFEEDSMDYSMIPDSIKNPSIIFRNVLMYSLNESELITDSSITVENTTIFAHFYEFNYEDKYPFKLFAAFYMSDLAISALYILGPSSESTTLNQLKETCFNSVLINE